MDRIQFTLLSDGTSDRALLPILSWVLQSFGENLLPQGEWADLSVLRGGVKSLAERIRWAVELFPCDVLFIHRDAEKQEPKLRYEEIAVALQGAKLSNPGPATVAVVPVRMQEAWLLSDEKAIRKAAGNPSGRQWFALPRLEELETLADPKAVLHDALKTASGLAGRRLKKFEPRRHCFAVAEFAAENGYDLLKQLPAFKRLLVEVEKYMVSR